MMRQQHWAVVKRKRCSGSSLGVASGIVSEAPDCKPVRILVHVPGQLKSLRTRTASATPWPV